MSASLYLFNPDNDLALANNSPTYQAPQSARLMADDLCTLPAWFATAGDSVMVSSIADAERWQREETAGLLTEIHWHSFRMAPFVGELNPWGWNPALVKRLRQWGVEDSLLPSDLRMETMRRLSSREQAVKMLRRFVAAFGICGESSPRPYEESSSERTENPFPRIASSSSFSEQSSSEQAESQISRFDASSRLCGESSSEQTTNILPRAASSELCGESSSEEVGYKPSLSTASSSLCGESFFCTELSQVEPLVCGWGETLLKAPFSGSGKGLRQGRGTWTPALANWCSRVMRGQGGVVVEPLYNKVEDFAMEFRVEDDEVTFAGYSLFRTDGNGAYKGNLLATDAEIESRLARYVDVEALHALRCEWLQALRQWLFGVGYRGYLGVDMMVCRFAEAPIYRIHPCVEINLRMNMGVVARLFHDRFVEEGRTGTFTVEYWQDAAALCADHLSRKAASPLVVSEGRILSGYLSLNPIGKGSHYRASVMVE